MFVCLFVRPLARRKKYVAAKLQEISLRLTRGHCSVFL